MGPLKTHFSIADFLYSLYLAVAAEERIFSMVRKNLNEFR